MLGTNIHRAGEESILAPSEVQRPDELVRNGDEEVEIKYRPGFTEPRSFQWKRELATPAGNWISNPWLEDRCYIPGCDDALCHDLLVHGMFLSRVIFMGR